MATHSSILAWEIPWTEESGGLESMGSQESDMTEQRSTLVPASIHGSPSFPLLQKMGGHTLHCLQPEPETLEPKGALGPGDVQPVPTAGCSQGAGAHGAARHCRPGGRQRDAWAALPWRLNHLHYESIRETSSLFPLTHFTWKLFWGFPCCIWRQ